MLSISRRLHFSNVKSDRDLFYAFLSKRRDNMWQYDKTIACLAVSQT